MSKRRQTRRDFLKSSLAASLLPATTSCSQPEPTEPSEPPRRPNILFLFSDQHRWDWTPAHTGVPVPMPNLEALMARGLAVERAYCAAPVCAPSRACLASGREYDSCGVPTNSQSFPLEQPNFYRKLRDGGYHVLGCGKMDLCSAAMQQVIRDPASLGDGPVGLGLDGRRFVGELGFTSAINNAGKGAGALIYSAEPIGPKDPYYAYLDSLDPKQGLVCSQDMLDRRGSGRPHQWGVTRISPLDEAHYCDNWIGDLSEASPTFPSRTPTRAPGTPTTTSGSARTTPP